MWKGIQIWHHSLLLTLQKNWVSVFTHYRCFNKSENPGPVLNSKVSVEYGFITRSITRSNVSLLTRCSWNFKQEVTSSVVLKKNAWVLEEVLNSAQQVLAEFSCHCTYVKGYNFCQTTFLKHLWQVFLNTQTVQHYMWQVTHHCMCIKMSCAIAMRCVGGGAAGKMGPLVSL